MATINKNFKKLGGAYLFSEIAKRIDEFQAKNPGVELMRLGIGDTTVPLPKTVIKGMSQAVKNLSKEKTYTGYGPAQGNLRLRQAIQDFYKKRNVHLSLEEIFVSDGAKSDSANIQSIFGADNIVAVTDPVYPVYVDSNVIAGRAGELKEGRHEGIIYMDSEEKNGFVPMPPRAHADIIYLCSPNNPTGAVMTKKDLEIFVDYALKNKSVIIFDACYAEYITDSSLPKSIYEIEGAKKCAIEINSFSKWAGFTGVRAGWTIVPIDLVIEGTTLNSLWARRQSSMFNGASNISQEGALAVLSTNGQKECQKIISYYMQNAAIVKESLTKLGYQVYGGIHAPYLWVKAPIGMDSWGFFEKLMREAHVVTTPGAGFGRKGEGYVRFSAFGNKKNVLKAMKSIEENLKK